MSTCGLIFKAGYCRNTKLIIQWNKEQPAFTSTTMLAANLQYFILVLLHRKFSNLPFSVRHLLDCCGLISGPLSWHFVQVAVIFHFRYKMKISCGEKSSRHLISVCLLMSAKRHKYSGIFDTFWKTSFFKHAQTFHPKIELLNCRPSACSNFVKNAISCAIPCL